MLMAGDIDDNLIPLLSIGGGFVIAIVVILGCTAKSILQARAREASRREIAAYIAEGSMTADEGARLMEAGSLEKSSC
jgi:hypothetical protein